MKFPEVGNKSNGGKSGLFIKLKDGDKVRGVFRGDPHIYRQHWVDNRSTICSGKDVCEICKAGEKPQFRFRLNLIVNEDGIYLAKIFDGNYPTYIDLKALHDSDYDLEQTLVTISRSGEKQQTKYVIMPVKDNGGLNKEKFTKINKIPLNDLSGKGEQEAPKDELEEALEDKF